MIRPPRGVWSLHDPERLLRAQERAGQVGVDDGLPPLQGRGPRAAPAGAPMPALLNEQVEPAEPLADDGEQRRDRRRIADVARHGDGAGADLGRGRLQRLGAPAGEHDREAVGRQRDGDGAADAAAGAGDDARPASRAAPAIRRRARPRRRRDDLVEVASAAEAERVGARRVSKRAASRRRSARSSRRARGGSARPRRRRRRSRSASICSATVTDRPGIVRHRRSPSAPPSIVAGVHEEADRGARRGEPVTHVVGTGSTASWPFSGSRMMFEKKPDAAAVRLRPAGRRSSAAGCRRRRRSRAACSRSAAARRSPSACRSSSAASGASRRRSRPGTARRRPRSTSEDDARPVAGPSARIASSSSRVPSRLTR